MNYQMSGMGVFIILAYSGVVLLLTALPLYFLLKRFRWKWAVIVIIAIPLLAAPWAEEYWIARNFALVCKDAGVHVVRRVAADGYVDDTRTKRSRDEVKLGIFHLDQQSLASWDAGYRYQEEVLSDGSVLHTERVAGGLSISVLDKPTTQYHYKHAYQPTPFRYEEPIGWKLRKLEYQVVESRTGEVIGRSTTYTRFPNLADWQWIRFFGYGNTSCPDPEKGPHQPAFPQAVLIPQSSR